MTRLSSGKRLGVLLSLLFVAAYLTPAVRAQGCLEYTVWNEAHQRCECPDQECCDYWCPFIPYGCPDKGTEGCPVTAAETLQKVASSNLLMSLRYNRGLSFSRETWLGKTYTASDKS
jgi:hypothetical protein